MSSTEPMIASLLRGDAYDHPVEGPRLLETHISWILLTGRYAYKIKKPVNLGFVDFSSLERRRWFCEEELRLNRRLASGLYLGLRTVHGPPDQAHFGGDGPSIETAVQMLQFPQEALLANATTIGKLGARDWRQLAETLADFHAQAAVADGVSSAPHGSHGMAVSVRRSAQENLDTLARCPDASALLPALQNWTDEAFHALAPLFEQRLRDGRVRECHGDLHLGNMVFLDDRITAFDCLEFSPELRWIDVISEMAFLVMDLGEHGRSLDGARLLDCWLDRSGDYAGLVVWRWYVVYRALVRAKVTALRLGQPGLPAAEAAPLQAAVQKYLSFAHAATVAPPGNLVITHGVSGSGKSHLSRVLCDRLGWIHLRSDAERKRLIGHWGAGSTEDSTTAPELYTPEVNERLYGRTLPEQADAVLQAGFSVIVDATFLKQRHRELIAALARRRGVRFQILDCRAPDSVARERIIQRQQMGGDPSDADISVLNLQLSTMEPLNLSERTAAIEVHPGSDLDEITSRLG